MSKKKIPESDMSCQELKPGKGLELWFSERGLQISQYPGEPLEMLILVTHADLLNQKLWAWALQSLPSPPGDCDLSRV